MNDFSGSGYEWRVEVLADQQDHPASDRAEYEHFWGEQYEWTSLLPTAWKLSESADLRVKAPGATDHCKPSWWITPLHLLGLGLGWTDIAKGIEAWERSGFKTEGQPLLNFVYNTWGASISALGLWLRLSPYSREITNALEDLRSSDYVARPLSNIRAKEVQLFQEEVRDLMIEHGHAGKRFDLAEQLIDDDGDVFHLSGHFSKSLWPSEDMARRDSETHLRDEDVECYELYPEEFWFEAHLERYAGFHLQLNAIAGGFTGESVFNGKETVRVFIKNFGYLGNFTRHPETQRWYLNNLDDSDLSAADVHLWGN